LRTSAWIGCCGALLFCIVSPGVQATDVCGGLSGTLSAAGSPYRATCDLVVGVGDMLVIDAGVELRFAAGTGMTVDGQLEINGTSVSQVRLTSDLGIPAPGDWAELTVNGTAALNWTEMRYGQGIVVAGSLEAGNSVFQFNGGPAQPPSITFGPGSGGSVKNSLFDQNAQPLFLAIDTNPVLSGLTVNLNHTLINGVQVQGGLWSISRTWSDADVPYAFNAAMTFSGGTTQILEAGVIFKFFPPDTLTFGNLTVLGTAVAPVVLTSIWDDAVGGVTFPPSPGPSPGDWGDLAINGLANIDHLQVRFGSNTTLSASANLANCRFTSNAGGISVLASADFSNCVFELGQGVPAVSFGPSTSGSVTDSVFNANYQPLLLDVDANPSLVNLIVNVNHSFLNGVEIVGGAWTINRTWTDPAVPYVVVSSISFAPGTTQTVDPGVVFKVNPGLLPTVGISFQDLDALGTGAQLIVFTSLGDGSVGGNTFPGGLPAAVAGDWGPLEVTGTANLDGVVVQYGTSIELLGSATIDNSNFALNSDGVVVHNTALISGTVINANGLVGFGAGLSFGPGATGSVNSSLFFKNYVPILLDVDANPTLTDLSFLGDNTLINGVEVVGGSWTVSRTWTAIGVPYMPDSDIDFSPGSTQTMAPGVVFKFVPFGGAPLKLTFGNLVAVGTAVQPIVFTSAVDPSIAPGALVGAAGPPVAGDWGGLVVAAGGVLQLAHARVSYAAAGLEMDGVGGTVEQSEISSNVTGLNLVLGGFARVTETDFLANDTAVALDATSTADLGNLGDVDPLNDGLNGFTCNSLNVENLNLATLPAENNFWGSAPPDPGLIIGPVDDVPFLLEAPRLVLRSLSVGLDVTRNDVELQWDDVAPACGYRLFRSTQPDTGFVDISGPLATNSFTDPGAGGVLQNYYYRVFVD